MLAPWLGLVFIAFELGVRLTRRSDASASTGADRGSLALLWLTIGLAIGLALIAPRFAPQADFRLGAWGVRAAVAGFALGLALRAWAIVRLGRFFTVDVAIAHDHALQTGAPYAWVRHPSYTGLLVMFAALGLTFGNWVSLACLLVPILLAVIRRIAVEERALEAAFGDAWTAYAARTRRLVPFLFALLAVAAPLPAGAEVKALELGGFAITHDLVVAGTPTQVFDMITGDLRPWWDHTFSDHPKALYIEPWPGGGFYEIFDDAGNGVRHATVTWAERGKRLRFEGPLGLSGNAVTFVSTYDLAARGADSTAIHFTASVAGKVEKGWAEGVDQVWDHFLFERLKPWAGTSEARRRKPWPRPK